MTGRPPPSVLVAFGVGSKPLERQEGGQGSAWRAADVILKPVDDQVEAQWCAELLAKLSPVGFRIGRPVLARDGSYVAQGWSAWKVVDGSHDREGRWPEVIKTGQALHTTLAGVPRPNFLDARTGVWSIGDRVAWQEQPLQVHDPTFKRIAEDLARFLVPCREPDQLIHGDLTRNVLFSPGTDPAIIDFTPYWRPAAFSLAIVAVDAACWHGATPKVFDLVRGTDSPGSMLARAGLYRLVTSDRAALALSEPAHRKYLRDNRAAYANLLARLRSWNGNRM